MKKIFLCSLVLSLLSSSCIMNAAEASEKMSLITFATGIDVFKPHTFWVAEEHLENLTLGIPAEPSFKKVDGLNHFAHELAGQELTVACKKLITDNGGKNYTTGTVGITPALGLQANGFQWIAHTVVPHINNNPPHPAYIEGEAEQDAALQSCYRNIFKAAHEKGSSAVVTTLLGTEQKEEYSVERSMKNLQAVVLSDEKESLKKVYIVLRSTSDLLIALAALKN